MSTFTHTQLAQLVRAYKVACVTAISTMVGMDGTPSDNQLDASIEPAVLAVASLAATMSQPADAKLLWGVVANAGRMTVERKARWAHVVDATAAGSQSSIELCRRFGFDPDELCGQFPEAPCGDDEEAGA